MLVRSLLQRLRGSDGRASRHRCPRSVKPMLEALEDRTLPSGGAQISLFLTSEVVTGPAIEPTILPGPFYPAQANVGPDPGSVSITGSVSATGADSGAAFVALGAPPPPFPVTGTAAATVTATASQNADGSLQGDITFDTNYSFSQANVPFSFTVLGKPTPANETLAAAGFTSDTWQGSFLNPGTFTLTYVTSHSELLAKGDSAYSTIGLSTFYNIAGTPMTNYSVPATGSGTQTYVLNVPGSPGNVEINLQSPGGSGGNTPASGSVGSPGTELEFAL